MTAPPGQGPQGQQAPAHAAPAPAASKPRRKRKTTPFGVFKKAWVGVVIVIVLAVGGYAVDRLREVFGSNVHIEPGYEPIATEQKTSKPKRVLYEITGNVGPKAKVRISYYDENTEPKEVIVHSLPWKLLITTTNTSMAANIMAQTDGDAISCRITVDDDVKAEKATTGPSSLIGCMVKSA